MNRVQFGGGIIAWFAANPVASNLLLILVIVLGVMELGSLRREAFPSMEPDSISIAVTYQSGAAEQSEEGIAIKIEEQLKDVIGIKSLTSRSNASGATVTVEKESEYDLDTLLRDVKTRVDAISAFPAEAKNPVIKKAVREHEAVQLQLYGNASRHTLQKLAEELKLDLMAEPEIGNVSISGELTPMMVIEIDEAKLQAYGLSLSDVEEAVNAGSATPVSAVLRNEDSYLQLKASEQAYLKQDFAAIPLFNKADGRALLLGDVATIRDTWDDDSTALLRFNGADSIGIEVITTGLNDITKSVLAAERVVQTWRERDLLPQGVALATWNDRSVNIQQRLALLIKNAFTGMALVFVLLALFLNLTVAFWVAMGLPFVFFGTFYFMGDSYMGLTLNEFTTFGFILALGIVVDDAVVIGESIYSVRKREGDTLGSTIKGTLQVALPTLFGVLTTVAAFYALSQVSGRLGHLYAQFAAIVAIALILSVIESKLILPSHLAHLNTHRPVRKGIMGLWSWIQHGADSGLDYFAQRLYRPFLHWVLDYRYAVVVLFIAFAVFIAGLPFTGVVRMSFFPEIPGDTVRARLSMHQDASVGLTHRQLNRLERQAYAVDSALRDGQGNSGIANLQVLSESEQSGTITVELAAGAPYSLREFSRVWRERVGSPEGVKTLNIQSRRGMMDALRIELRASDEQTLNAAGRIFSDRLAQVRGISGIENNLDPTQPQLHLQLNEQGRALGLSTRTLASQIRQAFSGQVVQRYQRNSDEIEVRVRYPAADRQNPADVINARIRTPDGKVMPLASVATITSGYTRESITRIDGKRAIYLTAEVDKDLVSGSELVQQLKRDLVPQLLRQFAGLDIHFGGEAEQQAETQSSMIQQFLLALLIIYILLAVPLGSYTQPVLIMTAIPFGIIGAIIGHWITGLSLGILSFNGIVALSGVVVNDSLLLVARFNDIRADATDFKQALEEACQSRLRAVLLTSFTTFAGLLPLLAETERQAQFLIPAAVSLAYGIMFATFITLLLIPSLLFIQRDVGKVGGWR